jgi:hypothetical protein
MAANTRSAWTESRVGYTGGSLYKATSTVLSAVANAQLSTVKTPRGLDVRRPWTVIIHSTATVDNGQTPVLELWGGFSDSFVMTNGDGTATTAATDGAKLLDLCDDITLAVTARPFAFHIIPIRGGEVQSVANVVTVAAIATGYKVHVPVLPYYAIAVQGDSTLDAVTTTVVIIQA